ncbi:MAG: winged helix-turn-helix transcriptional regulator, partial [Thermoplasmata archaeon]|nr:winged helix-turn-helix transcriptional regulator [Thermoplasmata archaeon]
IKANPGAHYNLIKRKLNINNGALAYHISVLEREKFIRSRMDGPLKRFYPSDMNPPKGHELTEMERKIIEVIRANPGFSQKEIAITLGLSPQVINYHIKALARDHRLRLARVGKRTLCYVNEDYERAA